MEKKDSGLLYSEPRTLIDAVETFDSEAGAEAWFIRQRWPGGVVCPFCKSDNIQIRDNRKPAPFRCRDCRKDFSVKTGTLMHDSKLPLSKWAMAMYLSSANLEGVLLERSHRQLGITLKAARHMALRISECYEYATRTASFRSGKE